MATPESIAHYRITSKLGQGGMGAVYRATDTKLNREVAIKVLPDALAADPDYLARFAREAQVLASLNHPNIAVLHGIEDRALVMELVPGPTLEERIAAGRLPADEALPIARQIAEALEAAHEKGIIHRDLKPANIKVTPEGVVKVLDFGLAKAADPAPASAASHDSPTLTMRATQAGIIVGTAAYMAPEQAAGKPVDRRADIWSFGVVLYEILSGQRLFHGETVSDTLADVLRAPIDFSRVPASTPPAIVDLLGRCLDRDRKTRLQAIGEARIAIQRAIADPHSGAATRPPGARASSRLPWIVASIAAIIAAGACWFASRANRPQDLKPLVRLDVDLGPDAIRGARVTAVISPDGKYLVFPGRAPRGGSQLFIRRLDQRAASPIPGSEMRQAMPNTVPFFSPDSQWVAFVGENKIEKAPVEGGASIPLADVPASLGGSWGGSWSDDGSLYLGSYTGIYRLSSNGGVPAPVKPGMGLGIFPSVLPGSRALLFGGFSRSTASVSVLNLRTGQVKALIPSGVSPTYLLRAGAILYLQGGTLFAVRFDPDKFELRGSPVPMAPDVDNRLGTVAGGGQYTVSNGGTLAYMSVQSEEAFPILWLDASGKTQPILSQTARYGVPRLSPDGKRLAFRNGADVWCYDLQGGVPRQLTFNEPSSRELAWAPDSRHIIYGDSSSIWWVSSDGGGQPQQLATNLGHPRPMSVAPDGRVAFSISTPDGIPDLYTLSLDLANPDRPKPGTPEPFLHDPSVVEVDGAFSPDGKFMAYASSESGTLDIFVRAFPGPSGKWRISGGHFPAWARAGRQLFYLDEDDHIMVVDYSINGASFSAGEPRVWSPTTIRRTNVFQNFDISPDGKRAVIFPALAGSGAQGSLHTTFLLNFFDELQRRLK